MPFSTPMQKMCASQARRSRPCRRWRLMVERRAATLKWCVCPRQTTKNNRRLMVTAVGGGGGGRSSSRRRSSSSSRRMRRMRRMRMRRTRSSRSRSGPWAGTANPSLCHTHVEGALPFGAPARYAPGSDKAPMQGPGGVPTSMYGKALATFHRPIQAKLCHPPCHFSFCTNWWCPPSAPRKLHN